MGSPTPVAWRAFRGLKKPLEPAPRTPPFREEAALQPQGSGPKAPRLHRWEGLELGCRTGREAR